MLRRSRFDGYAIAQKIRALSGDQLSVEEGSLSGAPEAAGQWVGESRVDDVDTGRQVRSYRVTAKGLKQLETEQDDYQRMADAIAVILESA